MWEARNISGGFGTAGQKRCWMRELHPLVDDEPLTPLQRVALAADFTSPYANSGSAGLQYLNTDITLYLHRYPAGEWIGFETTAHQNPPGPGGGTPGAGRGRPRFRPVLLFAFAASGALGMAYQIVWTRSLVLVIGSSAYAFSAILVTFLAGIAVGSLLYARLAARRRLPDGPLLFAVLMFGIGISAFLLVPLFDRLPSVFFSLFKGYGGSVLYILGIQFLVVFLVVLLPTTLMGMTFPCLAAHLTRRVDRFGSDLGALRLAPFSRADFDAFFEACVLDPGVIHYWWAYGQPGLSVVDKRQMAIEDFVEPAEQGLRDLGLVVWTARLRDASMGPAGDFVGIVGIVPPEMPSQGSEPDLGYLLAARYQGLGLATEAARAVVADAFERYGLERLAALADEPTAASRRVLEKAGFRQVLRWVDENGGPMLRYQIEGADLATGG